MHPVDPWLVLFIVFMSSVMGGGIGFKIGVDYACNRLLKTINDSCDAVIARATEAPGVGERPNE